MAKYNFCTLFDSNFMLQGLTMYRSLENTCNDFHLYILAFDDLSVEILKKLKLNHATIIGAKEFESEELKKIKIERTKREYYWTCTPSIILYCLEHFNLEVCTYLDADLFFFDTPKILLDELRDDSILITEHRYDQTNSKAAKLGKYCVQFNTFKNNDAGLKALKWWRDRCNEWCYAVSQDGKFGDQKYLDDWLVRFKGVHELQNLGGGVAPWNISQYDFFEKNGAIIGKTKTTKKEFPVIFYHFHHTEIYRIFGKIKIKSYQNINKKKNLQKYIYKPYAKSLTLRMGEIKKVDNKFGFNFESKAKFILESAKELVSGLSGVVEWL